MAERMEHMKREFDLNLTCTLDKMIDMAVYQNEQADQYIKAGKTDAAEYYSTNEMLIEKMIIALFNVRAKDVFDEVESRLK